MYKLKILITLAFIIIPSECRNHIMYLPNEHGKNCTALVLENKEECSKCGYALLYSICARSSKSESLFVSRGKYEIMKYLRENIWTTVQFKKENKIEQNINYPVNWDKTDNLVTDCYFQVYMVNINGRLSTRRHDLPNVEEM